MVLVLAKLYVNNLDTAQELNPEEYVNKLKYRLKGFCKKEGVDNPIVHTQKHQDGGYTTELMINGTIYTGFY